MTILPSKPPHESSSASADGQQSPNATGPGAVDGPSIGSPISSPCSSRSCSSSEDNGGSPGSDGSRSDGSVGSDRTSGSSGSTKRSSSIHHGELRSKRIRIRPSATAVVAAAAAAPTSATVSPVATDRHADPAASKAALIDRLSREGSPSAYNSGDEYQSAELEPANNNSTGVHGPMHEHEQYQHDIEFRRYEKKIRKHWGWHVRKMRDDGACMFRACADQLYGDEEYHGIVRRLCLDYMQKNSAHYSQYVTEDFQSYIDRKRREHIHGNHVEMQAIAELYDRPIEVFSFSGRSIQRIQAASCKRVLPSSASGSPVGSVAGSPGNSSTPPLIGSNQAETVPIRLLYWTRLRHYDSLFDPYRPGPLLPTVYKPPALMRPPLPVPSQHQERQLDRDILQSALIASEQESIETAMLEDKLRATDWESTEDAIHEQVARESYLCWLRDQQQRASGSNATAAAAGAPSSSAGRASSPTSSAYGNISPSSVGWSTNYAHALGSFANFGSQSRLSLAAHEDQESEQQILARVLRESQREYLDSLRAQRAKSSSPTQQRRSPTPRNSPPRSDSASTSSPKKRHP